MALDLKTFEFKRQNIFFLADVDNEIWFKAIDIAKILEYQNPRDAIISHVGEKYRCHLCDLNLDQSLLPPNSKSNTVYINEFGLYMLMMKSQKPVAKDFQDWIHEHVISFLRNKRHYNLQNKLLITENNLQLLEHKNQELVKNDELLRNKIENMKKDIVAKTRDTNKHHTFILMKKNNESKYPYYVLRIQKYNLNSRLRRLHILFPKIQTLLTLRYNPNAINLYNRIKELLPISYKGNSFRLAGRMDENTLMSGILQLHVENEQFVNSS